MSNDEQHLEVGDSEKKIAGAENSTIARRKRENRSLIVYTVVAIALALAVRFFIAAPYLVSGPSMNETFHNNDYLIVDRLTYDFEAPQRGDVIVFKMPENPSETLIKRIVGLPGETVTIQGTHVVITNAAHPEGFTLAEPYITPQDQGGPSGETVTLGPDDYFVMGDNRVVSYDSRSWGMLPRADIIGRVFLRLYPFTVIGVLPGEARYSNP